MRTLTFTSKPTTANLWAGMAFALLGLLPTVSRGDVILGNLGAASGGSTGISPIVFIGASFTMGNRSYSLSGAKIVLTNTPDPILFGTAIAVGGM